MLLSLPRTVIFPSLSFVYFLLILQTQSLLHETCFFIPFSHVCDFTFIYMIIYHISIKFHRENILFLFSFTF